MKRFINIMFLASLIYFMHDGVIYSQQIKNFGIPYIKNYSSEEYKASDQNWAIYQDKRGVFYFGNTLGVLEFDGISWRLIELPNKSSVRSLCADEKGKIFVGGSNEFGFLVIDSRGNTNYSSTMHLIPNEYKNFEDVWEIFNTKEGIVFRTNKYLFILKDEKIEVIKPSKEFRYASVVRGKLYVTDTDSGILVLEGNRLRPFISAGFFVKDHPILLPYDKDKILMVTRKNGLFIYDGKQLIQWKISIIDFLKKNILYSAFQINTNYYAFGTWLNGFVIVDKTGKVIQFLNKEAGLLSNTVYNFYIDKQKNLWCALDGGISQVEINSAFSFYTSDNGFQAQCYTAAVFKNVFYAGGGPYLYYRDWLAYDDPLHRKSFMQIKKTAPQLWKLAEIEGKLYGAHSFDILRIDKNEVAEIPVNDKIVWDVKLAPGNPQILLAGENDGIYVLKKEDNTWKLRNKIIGYDELARWLVLDEKNNYWCTTYGDRIFKFKINKNYDSISNLKYYDIKPNYPLAVGNRLTIVKGKIIVAGADGFYFYNEIYDRFELYNDLNNLIIAGKPVNIAGYDEVGNIWFTDYESTGEFLMQPNGKYKVNRAPFYKLDITSESYPVFAINDSNVIIGRTNGFIHYDPTYKKDYNIPFNTLIRKVELLHNDSLISDGGVMPINLSSKPKMSDIKIPYQNNSIRFKFAATSFENVEKNQFQYKLIGFEANWSNWSMESKKEYTNLPEGHYSFTVRARNVFRVIGDTAKFDFQILAPWYRSIWAYFFYFLLVIGIIFAIVYGNSRRLLAANLKLEGVIKERTIEILNQKEEIQSHYEQLKEVNAVKDKFYSIISHDLINTIGAIRSFSELLQKYSINKNDDKLTRYSNALYTSSKSAFELLSNLLNWTRLQTGRVKVNAERIDFIDLVKDALTLYQHIIENKELLLNSDYPEALFIYADKNMISTILRNLISNAVKFTPENGKIFITVSHTDTDYIFIIADTGVGMNEADLKKLFRNDVYFQRHGTNKEMGTGLGLLLIKNFIELHHGKITIESEPDKGTKFSFTAPISVS